MNKFGGKEFVCRKLLDYRSKFLNQNVKISHECSAHPNIFYKMLL